METGFYEDASLYDILHTPGTAREVDGLERIARVFARDPEGAWLEPACGSGRYLRVIAGRGRPAIGFDREPAMVAYARERLGDAPGAHVFEADMTAFAPSVTEPIAFAFNTINTIRHLGCDADMLAHLSEMKAALGPGGVYAVGIGVSVAGWVDPVEDVWTATRGAVSITQTVQYLPPEPGTRDEQVLSHMTVTTPGGERHVDSRYTLRTYTRAQWRSVILRSAMQVVGVVDEDGYAIDAPKDGYAVYVLAPA